MIHRKVRNVEITLEAGRLKAVMSSYSRTVKIMYEGQQDAHSFNAEDLIDLKCLIDHIVDNDPLVFDQFID